MRKLVHFEHLLRSAQEQQQQQQPREPPSSKQQVSVAFRAGKGAQQCPARVPDYEGHVESDSQAS